MLPKTIKLNMPDLMATSHRLSKSGRLAISANNLVYLDIDDAYIHQLFPLLQNPQVKMPDYFGKGSAGAHITLIYPEENKEIDEKYLGQEHDFLIRDLVSAEIGRKIYYVLLVESSSLLQLRRKYNLADLLCFKGYSIGFHITIGVKV